MKNKKHMMQYPQHIDQEGGGIPSSCYILLGIIFIGIIYLLVLKTRIEEFFTGNNTSNNSAVINTTINSIKSAEPKTNQIDIFYIKQDINPTEIDKIWEGQINDKYISFWQRRNKKTMDLYNMGQYAHVSDLSVDALPNTTIVDTPVLNMLVKGGKFPIKYIKIWSTDMAEPKLEKDFSIWQPIAPEGYVAMGDVVVPSLSSPSRSSIVCLPKDSLVTNGLIKTLIQQYNGKKPMSIWSIGNYSTFMAINSLTKPDARQEEIMDITQEALSQKEFDSTEKYNGLKVKIATFKITKNKMLNSPN